MIGIALPTIKPQKIKLLEKLGIRTVRDLLYYFPSRYIELGAVKPIADLILGESASVIAEVVHVKAEKTWKSRMNIAQATLKDADASIQAVWFNQPYLASMLKPGTRILVSGKISLRKNKNEKYFANPTWELVGDSEADAHQLKTSTVLPVYSETYGMSSLWLRWQIRRLLSARGGSASGGEKTPDIPETLPEHILKTYNLPVLRRALVAMHTPRTLQEIEAAKKRFSFEEIFCIQLHQQQIRKKTELVPSVAIQPRPDIIAEFTNTLPYALTGAQKRVISQILADFKKPYPMGRLLEGDVGSGKTIVATAVSLNAVTEKAQAAFMAPTEILARQHFHEFIRRLEPFRVNIALLTSGTVEKFPSKISYKKTADISRTQLLKELAAGDVHILIGTHSLINASVKFKKLALVIIDEQHRFGKEQRLKLAKEKEEVTEVPALSFGIPKNFKKNFHTASPHLLSMTATPIPRTLALTIYGNLDLSVLDEMPPGRKKVITRIVPSRERRETHEFIRGQLAAGRQAFVICPRIEKSDDTAYKNPQTALLFSDMKAVKEEYKKLSEEVFPDARIGMLHGKMKPEEKEGAMKKFKEGAIDILVSTSVVEVGVDVPNATIMMIEGGERYGLSQLHQFRGRVGRGEHQSYCLIFTESRSETVRERLKALESAKNGFELAEYDLMFRGPGELTGARQWGMSDVGMEALKNIKLVEFARTEAAALIAKDPQLAEWPALSDRVERLAKKIHFE